MAIDTTIYRDPATGLAMLTTDQAEVMARWLARPGKAGPEVAAIIGASGGETVALLARWVLSNAPVVRVAEAMEAKGEEKMGEETIEVGRAWWMLGIATGDAVKAARREGKPTP